MTRGHQSEPELNIGAMVGAKHRLIICSNSARDVVLNKLYLAIINIINIINITNAHQTVSRPRVFIEELKFVLSFPFCSSQTVRHEAEEDSHRKDDLQVIFPIESSQTNRKIY